MGNMRRILVRIRKNEAYLARWVELVRNMETRGLMSAIIKQAVLHYVRYGEIICIGKIHYSLQEFEQANKTIILTTYIKECPEIEEWLEYCAKSGNSKAGMVIRDIIKMAVEVVENDQPEWVPSFYDLDVLNRKGDNADKVSLLNRQREQLYQQKYKPDTTGISPVIQQNPATEVMTEKKPEQEEKKEVPVETEPAVEPAVKVHASRSDVHNQEIMGTGFRRKKRN